MPRIVDHEQRRRSIATAALDLISNEGSTALTIRSVATRLGGSITMVTHYYANRSELLLDMATQLAAGWQQEVEVLTAAKRTPREKLVALLEWLLPTDEEGRRDERARFALLAAHDEPECAAVIHDFDAGVRGMIAAHVTGLVDDARVPLLVDALRATTDGIVLGEYAVPEAWPPERQLATVHIVVDALIPLE
jgi:AcrR family transcriptional regulator